MESYFRSVVAYCHYATKPLREMRFMISIVPGAPFDSNCRNFAHITYNINITVGTYSLSNDIPFTIYHQGLFHSVRRKPSLNCFHRRRSLAILGHAGPRWWIRLSLHLVLALPGRLVHSRGVHHVTRLVHLLSLNRAMCPAHSCIPFLITSMMSFTHV